MSPPAVVEGLARDILNVSLAPQVEKEHFPANTKNESGSVGGVETTVSSIYFADKIMITISQAGRLSQWIQVPLSTASPTNFDTRLPTDGDRDTISSHIQPKTLMGAGGDERETMGQTISSQIASLITKRDPEEQRTIVVGIGLLKPDLDRSAWFDLLEMIAKAL